MPLTRLSTRTIDRQGGTILESTRTNPANVKAGSLPPHLASIGEGRKPEERVDLTDEVLQNIRFLELDGLVVIGDDDTQSFGAVLAAQGVPVWGIPETMDNGLTKVDFLLCNSEPERVIPHYLRAHYWWAYTHQVAVRVFERPWLINLILCGNYARNAVLAKFGVSLPGHTLQVACVTLQRDIAVFARALLALADHFPQ